MSKESEKEDQASDEELELVIVYAKDNGIVFKNCFFCFLLLIIQGLLFLYLYKKFPPLQFQRIQNNPFE